MAEASLSQTGYPGENDTDPNRADFLAKVNEALDENVTYGTGATNTNNVWTINYASDTWTVYNDGVAVNP
jgi:hypothetical protein